MKKVLILILICLGIEESYAQRRAVAPRRGAVVVHRAPARAAVVRPHRVRRVVYRPVWAPRATYARRWIYFPRYNFYWDNRANRYVYLSGARWIYATTPPPVVVNIDLSTEKHYELKEEEDEVENIQDKNQEHQNSYKAE